MARNHEILIDLGEAKLTSAHYMKQEADDIDISILPTQLSLKRIYVCAHFYLSFSRHEPTSCDPLDAVPS